MGRFRSASASSFLFVEYHLQGSVRLRRMALPVIRAADVKEYCWALRIKPRLFVAKRMKLKRLLKAPSFLAEVTAQVQTFLERRGHVLSALIRVYAM